MEYSVSAISKMTGISSRTIRYYDEIDLLKPERINSSGYRIYGESQINRLEQILYYKELGMKLSKIKEVLSETDFDEIAALKGHEKNLLKKRDRINAILQKLEKAINYREGNIKMSANERFEAFKKDLIDKNTEAYGMEVVEKYGKESVEKSDKQFAQMSKAKYDELEKLGNDLLEKLGNVAKTNNPASIEAQELAAMHKTWLGFTIQNYSKEMHKALVQMYVEDERFTAYYDANGKGNAQFLKEAVEIFVQEK